MQQHQKTFDYETEDDLWDGEFTTTTTYDDIDIHIRPSYRANSYAGDPCRSKLFKNTSFPLNIFYGHFNFIT
ncbi:hypothetical protein ACFFH4_04545 [Halalkalibacter alkalisediminis]|uniref:Uncharacterized protein n=1 Tax=Halalkalibacter alkalisediminis TaxID=935616 RepID=A0ABV6NC20_9BACI